VAPPLARPPANPYTHPCFEKVNNKGLHVRSLTATVIHNSYLNSNKICIIGVADGKVVVRSMKTAMLLKWVKTEQELQHIDCPQIK